MRFQHVMVKLPRCKIAEFTVYPHEDGRRYHQIQSDRRIIRVDMEEKTMVVSKSGRPYSIDLMEIRGAKTMGAPQDLLDQLKALPATGKVVQITG